MFDFLVVLVDFDDTLAVAPTANSEDTIINWALLDSMMECGLNDDNVVNIMFTIYDRTQAVTVNKMMACEAKKLRRIDAIPAIKEYTTRKTWLNRNPIGIDFTRRVVTKHDFATNPGLLFAGLGSYFKYVLHSLELNDSTDIRVAHDMRVPLARSVQAPGEILLLIENLASEAALETEFGRSVDELRAKVQGQVGAAAQLPNNFGKGVMFKYVWDCYFRRGEGKTPGFLFIDDKEEHLQVVTATAQYGFLPMQPAIETIHLPVTRGGVCELNQTQITDRIRACLARLKQGCPCARW